MITGGLLFCIKSRGSSYAHNLISASSNETNEAVFENKFLSNVVLPDWRGPVSKIAGKV